MFNFEVVPSYSMVNFEVMPSYAMVNFDVIPLFLDNFESCTNWKVIQWLTRNNLKVVAAVTWYDCQVFSQVIP